MMRASDFAAYTVFADVITDGSLLIHKALVILHWLRNLQKLHGITHSAT
jgi:hypothetical protein